jgi:anti-sigma regulatory factor (Ser/Thr protein kinase)
LARAHGAHDDGGAGITTSGRYLRTVGGNPAEIAQIRHDIKAIAATTGFSDRAGDVALALDELIANSQEHGEPPIEVEAWNDGRLVIEVSDKGTGFDRAEIWGTHPPRHTGHRGRGLWIVRQLADRVEIFTDDGSTRVRVEFTIDPGIGA